MSYVIDDYSLEKTIKVLLKRNGIQNEDYFNNETKSLQETIDSCIDEYNKDYELSKTKEKQPMSYNSTDFNKENIKCKLNECDDAELLRNICLKLFNIIDDIDTASDIAKNNLQLYQNLVYKHQEKRWDSGLTCDGYNIYVKK